MSSFTSRVALELKQLKNSLRGATNPRGVLNEARHFLSPAAFEGAVRYLEYSAPRGVPLIPAAFPLRLETLHKVLPFRPMSVDRECRWAIERLKLHATRIQQFVDLADAVSELVIRSNYKEALEALHEAEQTFGYSIWGIKLRFLLSGLLSGLQGQKQVEASIFGVQNLDPLVGFIVQFVSMRNEDALSPASFKVFFDRNRPDEEVDKVIGLRGLPAYVEHHVYPTGSPGVDTCAWLLAWENSSSILDLYETTLRVCGILRVHPNVTVTTAIRESLQELATRISDRRITALVSSLTGDYSLLTTNLDQGPFDLFLKGDYTGAFSGAEKLLESQPVTWEAVELLGRSAAATGAFLDDHPSPLWRTIATQVSRILLHAPERHSASEQLMRIALNHDSLHWGDRARGFLAAEMSGSGLTALRASRGVCFPPAAIHPYYALSRADSSTNGYLTGCEAAYGETLGVFYCRAVLEGCSIVHDEISREARFSASAAIAIRRGDWDEALAAAASLDGTGNRYFQTQATTARATALLRQGDLIELVKFVTAAYIQEPSTFHLLRIEHVCSLIDKQVSKSLSYDISLPLLFEIYSQNVGPAMNGRRRMAFLEFLNIRKIARPSLLSDAAEILDKHKLIFFLRYVCSIPLLQKLISLDSSRAVENERIAICQLLAELHPEGADVYESEIKEITTTQAVQGGIRQVEQSKIHVDIEGVRRVAAKNLRESFNRYRALSTTRIRELTKEIVAALSREADRDSPKVIAFSIPKDEGLSIFTSMVGAIRDEFVSNSQYGLNGYLSLRIRHGTLQGHLRGTLEASRILTQQEADSERYRLNDFWPEKMESLSENERMALGQKLATFSQDLDRLITTIRTEWVQVKIKEEETGLFDFTLEAGELQSIDASWTPCDSFDSFFDVVVSHLWRRLDRSLEIVRDKILRDAKRSFEALLTQLQQDVEALLRGRDDAGFGAALIAGRTGMQRALDRLASWFQLPPQTASTPLPLSLASQVAAETVGRFRRGRGFSVNTVAEADPSYARETWVSFVDIFLILFQNAVTHCGDVDPNVTVRLTKKGDELGIHVENTVAGEALTQSALEKVARITEQMARGESGHFVSTEGRSGLHKIRNRLENFGILRGFSFGFGGNCFSVDMQIIKERAGHASTGGRG